MCEYSSRKWEKLIITFSLSKTKWKSSFCDFERIACIKEAFIAAIIPESPGVKGILARRACRGWWQWNISFATNKLPLHRGFFVSEC